MTAPGSPLQIVPVIRLIPNGREPFSGETLARLLAKLREVVEQQRLEQLQIDCDTPDRLLPSYAKALAAIHQCVKHLSVTALAGWSNQSSWQDLQNSVDEIFPMFYDLEPDTRTENGGPLPRPLVDSAQMGEQLRAWSACRIPWYAGLPNFARLTVYDRAGKSRGHIRDWRWNDVCFNRALVEPRHVRARDISVSAESKDAHQQYSDRGG